MSPDMMRPGGMGESSGRRYPAQSFSGGGFRESPFPSGGFRDRPAFDESPSLREPSPRFREPASRFREPAPAYRDAGRMDSYGSAPAYAPAYGASMPHPGGRGISQTVSTSSASFTVHVPGPAMSPTLMQLGRLHAATVLIAATSLPQPPSSLPQPPSSLPQPPSSLPQPPSSLPQPPSSLLHLSAPSAQHGHASAAIHGHSSPACCHPALCFILPQSYHRNSTLLVHPKSMAPLRMRWCCRAPSAPCDGWRAAARW
jgi:hypothetical protein